MRTILQYIRPKLKIMGLQLFVKFAGTVVELLLPWMLSHILDEIVPKRDLGGVLLWGFYMILCAAGAVLGNVTANRMATVISRDITRKIRHDLFDRILHLSSRQTDRFTIPSLISRLSTDTYNVHQMIDRMQRLGVRAPILLLGGIAVTLSLEPVLTLILICALPLLGLVVYTVSKKGIPLYTKVQSAMDAMVRKVQENMTGVRVIKALSKSEYEKERFDEINYDVVRKDQRAGTIMAVTNPVMNLLLNGGLTLVVVVGAYRVNAGVTAPGVIIAFLSYFTIILNALMMVTRLFVMYSKGAASAKRLEEVLLAPDDMPVIESAPVRTDAHVAFENVSFSYNKVRDNLRDVSFALKRGETLGVIGATGSGKTTIVHLLMRFYDPDAGAVRIDGRDIRAIPDEVLHTMFGVAFQNDFLYADTIAENIDFGRDLPEAAIERAAENAQADFIRRRPLGFRDVLTVKGANLSGGQKQRLLIARALAGDPEILILDDSSSALDYGTDARLRQALSREYKDATKIIVAQRVSSILHADHILVLEDGAVIGSGRHEELLRSCESYKEIFDAQMGDVA